VSQSQEALSEKLGQPVKINHRATGKGKIEITYDSEEALQALLKKMI